MSEEMPRGAYAGIVWGLAFFGLLVWALRHDLSPSPAPIVDQAAYDQAGASSSGQENNNRNQQKSFWERTLDDPNAFFALWVAGFTGVLALSTIGLWFATLRHAGHMEDSVAIGKAQVRAYVSIPRCSVGFIEFAPTVVSPIVSFSASNSGQSPARNFLWNITMEYVNADFRRRRKLADKFSPTGIDIPAGREIPDQRVIIADMTTAQVAAIAPTIDTMIINVKIDFTYTDVFGGSRPGEAFFVALGKRNASSVYKWEVPENSISAMPRPNNWIDGNSDS